MDDGAVVVRLDVDGIELDGFRELFERRVVTAESPERPGEARTQTAVVRARLHELAVLRRSLGELSRLKLQRGEVAVARRRLRADVAETLEALQDLGIHLRVGHGASGSGRGRTGLPGRHGRRRGEIQGLGQNPSRHVRALADAVQGQDGRRDVEDRRRLEARAGPDVAAVEVQDAFEPVILLAHAPHVARLAGVVVEAPELESVVREHDERRAPVHRGEKLANEAVRVEVHLLDGVPIPLLLVRELAREILHAEEVPEEVGRRVEPLDVDEQVVGPLGLPEVQADPGVGLRRRVRPAEVRQVVFEAEGPGELLGRHVDERRDLLAPDVLGLAGQRPDRRLERLRESRSRGVGLLEPVLEQEVVREVVADDRSADRLRGPRRPPADDVRRAPRRRKDVPERLHAAHLARDGQLFARRRIDRDEMSDLVLVGSLSRRDRRPDHRREQRLRRPQRTVSSLLPQPGEIRKLAFGHQQIDRRRVGAVDAEDHHAAGPSVCAAPAQKNRSAQEEDGGQGRRRSPRERRPDVLVRTALVTPSHGIFQHPVTGRFARPFPPS